MSGEGDDLDAVARLASALDALGGARRAAGLRLIEALEELLRGRAAG